MPLNVLWNIVRALVLISRYSFQTHIFILIFFLFLSLEFKSCHPLPFPLLCADSRSDIHVCWVFRLPSLTAASYHVTSLNAASSAIRMTWCIRTTCVGVHILSVSSVSLFGSGTCQTVKAFCCVPCTFVIANCSAAYVTHIGIVFISYKVGYKLQCLILIQ